MCHAKSDRDPALHMGHWQQGQTEKSLFKLTIRYDPLRGLTFISCGGLQDLVEVFLCFFVQVKAILDVFLETFVAFTSNLHD